MVRRFVEILVSDKVISIAVTVIVATFIVLLINRAKDKINVSNQASIRTKKRSTIISLIANICKSIVLMISLIIILSKLGINVTAIATSLGIVGVIAGLALQDALKDIIAGCNIILDDYYVVGDIVTFKDFTGTVSEFSLKKTKILGFDGTELVVANREITAIKNLSCEDTVWYLNIPVAYEISEKKVEKVMMSIIDRIKETGLTVKDPEYLGINNFCDSNVDYLLTATCKSKDRYVLRREILKIVKDEFDSKGIKIPYPQVEVHNGK